MALRIASETREYLSHVPRTYLSCRRIAHAWDDSANFTLGAYRGRRVYEQMLTCMRCAMTRTDRYSTRDMELVSRAYGYPEGYLVPAGVPVTRQDVRKFVTGELAKAPTLRAV